MEMRITRTESRDRLEQARVQMIVSPDADGSLGASFTGKAGGYGSEISSQTRVIN